MDCIRRERLQPAEHEEAMARRSGKAANRRSKQRPARRAGARPAPGPGPANAPTPAQATTETAARAPTMTSAPPPAAGRLTRPARGSSASVGSALAEAARAEYHYVSRDLRNMAVLVVIMAVLLTAAVFAFHAAGIVAS
jgi:cobalamin biosynthesis Mg chelatase CobN